MSTRRFNILEQRDRNKAEILKAIEKNGVDWFHDEYWDARVFGNTFLEEKDKKGEKKAISKHLRTGVIQVAHGRSIAPIDVIMASHTSKSGVQGEKDRGFAPLGIKMVPHAVYAIPFFVSPGAARHTRCEPQDIELFLRLIPGVYSSSRSACRINVEVLHAWYFTFKSALGGGELHLLNSLMPTKTDNPDEPSLSVNEYEFPTPKNQAFELFGERVASVCDLMTNSPPTSNGNIQRAAGLIIISVTDCNVNGDPDNEGAPRQLDNGYGFVSRYSVTRKVRDMVLDKGPEWEEVAAAMKIKG
jgi:CRISPR/Cas system type I-B associated protein Csh2 (Cas7 group RAMP superfamily)